TRCLSDWSSDVCSSDLARIVSIRFLIETERHIRARRRDCRERTQSNPCQNRVSASKTRKSPRAPYAHYQTNPIPTRESGHKGARSEERRVGKEGKGGVR